ncbi:hemin ABC transporter substrate-binding protein [Endozoicomonas sp. 8E]|uniref:heme/hemin ABC transporter substrate-binding protein n=1 Tax=Endozoicomonas sp. 8E TaxID=3035692 RepID=UPI002938EB77|nr:ABC transporter substrate-binding protein [Endozoicomonas sp. 8E]WOG27680.1 ABC transporter substrate-binding protein [Endozoicomonas sp. 8E]
MKKLLATLAVAALLPLSYSAIATVTDASHKVPAADEKRIVSAGNGITEIIYALGAGDQLVAVDLTSNYPPQVNKLPKLGYHKQLSAEGILALKPDMLIGTDDMGPETTITQLEMAGLEVESYAIKNSAKNIHERIHSLAKLLDKEKEGEVLWKSIDSDLKAAKEMADGNDKPRVLFLLAMEGRNPSVSGAGTEANALIKLAGGFNPAEAQFNSYKPLSNESLLILAPDVIIYSDRGRGLTMEQLLESQPVLKQTPAGKNARVIPLDGRLLLGGLGPRTGETALSLAKAFYPES